MKLRAANEIFNGHDRVASNDESENPSRRHARPQRNSTFTRQIDSLIPGRQALTRSMSYSVIADEATLRGALAALFTGGRAHRTASSTRSLTRALLKAFPESNDGRAPFLRAFSMAEAIRSVGVNDPLRALQLLAEAKVGDESTQLFTCERALAASESGTEALGHLKGLTDQPTQLNNLRDRLALSAALQVEGYPVEEHASLQSLTAALRARAQSRIDSPIATVPDTPAELLIQALMYADDMNAGRSVQQHQMAAYAAWEKDMNAARLVQQQLIQAHAAWGQGILERLEI